MRPRLPDCDQLADVLHWRDGLWKGTWRPEGSPVLVKAWAVPGGTDASTRMHWQNAAAKALQEATPPVLWRQVDGDQIHSVVRWVEGTPPKLPLDKDHLRQLLVALDRLHDAGFVHRDICARNLLVTPDQRLLVLDLEEVIAVGTKADVVGTPAHMAPEVAAGAPPTASADLYAVGSLLSASHHPVFTALARSDHPALRAARATELLSLLALPEDAPPRPVTLSGPSTLHKVPEQAKALHAQPHGAHALARLRAVGFGTQSLDDALELTPDDLQRWRALLEGPRTIDVQRQRIASGAPGLALWSLLSADRTVPRSVAEVDTLGAAAFETYNAAAQRRALAVLQHTACEDDTVPPFWTTLLAGALRLQKGDSKGVFEEVSALARPPRPWARRARDVSLMRAAFGVSPTFARQTLDTVAGLPSPDDPDAAPRLLAWSGLLDYRQGHYDDARCQLSDGWRARSFVHTRAMTASNLLAILLHLDSPTEAEAVSKEALAMLPPSAHPIAAARLATKMREAIYRGHAQPMPDIDLLDAVLPGLPPVSAALAVLNEAAAAWRCGQLELGARLADDAARRFKASRFKAGELLAGALAVCAGHRHWSGERDRLEAAVDGLLDRRRGVWLPAIAAQVLGLLAEGPDDPLAKDAADLTGEVKRSSDARREVLSLTECAAGGIAR